MEMGLLDVVTVESVLNFAMVKCSDQKFVGLPQHERCKWGGYFWFF